MPCPDHILHARAWGCQRFSSPRLWEFAHLQETQRLGLGDVCQRNDPRATQVPQAQGFMDLGYTQKFLREHPGLVEEAKMDPSSKPQVDISKPPGAPSDPPQRHCHPPFLFSAHQNPLGPRHPVSLNSAEIYLHSLAWASWSPSLNTLLPYVLGSGSNATF